jgi:adenylate kinase
MQLVLLGCPGAGKGTQAKFIEERYHLPHISTGDILRAAIHSHNELGERVKLIVESGLLVPDELITELIKTRLAEPDCANGFLLDGYPRTLKQAATLSEITSIDAIIDIDVPEEVVVKRLSGRRIHPASGRTYHLIDHPPKVANHDDITGEPLIQREDDHEETIRKRLAVYREQTSPLKQYYQQHMPKQYIAMTGDEPIQKVKEKIFAALDRLQK